jgi:hypothetical protein
MFLDLRVHYFACPQEICYDQKGRIYKLRAISVRAQRGSGFAEAGAHFFESWTFP